MNIRSVLASLIIVSVSATASAIPFQTSNDSITPDEAREAQEFAKQFLENLQKTRDLAPIFKELFLNNEQAEGFMNHLLSGLLASDARSKISPDDLRSLFVSMMNLGYLTELYVHSNFSIERDDVETLEPDRRYPQDVARLLMSDPDVASWLRDSDEPRKISNADQLRSIMGTLEKAIAMMREHYAGHPPEQTQQYTENLSLLNDNLRKPSIMIEEVGGDYPVGTRYINIDTPLLTLLLVKDKGRLKIVLLVPRTR